MTLASQVEKKMDSIPEDLKQHWSELESRVRREPWKMVGLAALAGVLGGSLYGSHKARALVVRAATTVAMLQLRKLDVEK